MRFWGWVCIFLTFTPYAQGTGEGENIELRTRASSAYEEFGDGQHRDAEGNIIINTDALPEIGSEPRPPSPTHRPIRHDDPMIRDMYDYRHLQDPTHQRGDICCYLAGIGMAFEVIFTISYLLYHASGTRD